jgi:Doubled CXXCH motif (Paired_CXXCH_1)
MKRKSLMFALMVIGLLSLVGLGVSGSAQAAKEKYFDRSGRLIVEEKPAAELLRPYDIKNREPAKVYPVPPAPFSEGIFPCSDCHADMEPNYKRRELKDMHTDIVLHHAEGQRWCLDCHNPTDRDKLRLVSGELISFSESYRLCGQCHGDKFRDWKVGVHGKRTGYWNGDKQYLLCAHCHNPHDPSFKPLKPLPPPVRPGDIRN